MGPSAVVQYVHPACRTLFEAYRGVKSSWTGVPPGSWLVVFSHRAARRLPFPPCYCPGPMHPTGGTRRAAHPGNRRKM